MTALKVLTTGRVRRLAMAGQVLGTILLGVATVFLVNWLSGRPGLRLRVDLTAAGENTLTPATVDLLEGLEEPVTVDVFYRGEAPPLSSVGAEVMERVFRLLILASDLADGQLIVRHHDPADTTAISRRLAELKLTGYENCVVLSRGPEAQRREVLRLRGDLAEMDPGLPSPGAGYRPPVLLAFHGEEALVRGLMRVTQGQSVRIAFSAGHGERDIFGLDEPGDMGRLHTELVGDGFQVEKWRLQDDGPPDDALALLAVVAPAQPFTESEIEALRRYVRGGGRLLVAPRLEFDRGPGSVADLAESWGLSIGNDLVLRPWINAHGQMEDGRPECAQLGIRADGMTAGHPITDPLRRGDRRVVITFAHPVDSAPAQTRARPLLVSGPYSWLDDAGTGTYDFVWQEGAEVMGSRSLALALALDRVPGAGGDAVREGRVLLLGSPEVLANNWIEVNRDFCLGAFNWLASRQLRIHISPRDPEARRLPLGEGDALSRLQRSVAWLLPGLCLLAALASAWRRRT